VWETGQKSWESKLGRGTGDRGDENHAGISSLFVFGSWRWRV